MKRVWPRRNQLKLRLRHHDSLWRKMSNSLTVIFDLYCKVLCGVELDRSRHRSVGRKRLELSVQKTLPISRWIKLLIW